MVKFIKGAAIGTGIVVLLCAGTYFVKKAHEKGYKKGAESMAPYAEFYENHMKSGYGKVNREDIRPVRHPEEDVSDIRPIGCVLQKIQVGVEEDEKNKSETK